MAEPDRANDDVTLLLRSAAGGDRAAMDRLLPLVYAELRARAKVHLSGERGDHTLQTTALAHEAYLRLIDQQGTDWNDRAHFFAIASTCIRRILVDHARKRGAARRSEDVVRIELAERGAVDPQETSGSEELLALDAALGGLKDQDERKARIVELRFFGGLSNEEVAQVEDVSIGTVERDLRLARAWLRRELSRDA